VARDFVFEALVLRRYPVGEAHRSVTFLTRERGLLSAIAHGAAKSQTRLKLLTTPLRHVTLKAYHDPVADSWKVTDLEPLHLFGGLGESLERSATATLWTELLLASWESGGIFDLFVDALALLDTASPAEAAHLEGQVLWRSLDTAGLMPDFSRCSSCGRVLSGEPAWMGREAGEALCRRCQPPSAVLGSELPAAALDHLLATAVLPLAEALGAPLPEALLRSLRREGRLAWERGLGRAFRSAASFPL